MKTAEAWAFALLAAVAVATLTFFYNETSITRHLDSVFLFESVTSIAQTGEPISTTVASWPDVLKTLNMPHEQVCSAALGFPTSGYNVLHNHAYLALYPIALLSMLTDAESAFALMNAVAHLALIFLPYMFLRRHDVPMASSAVFSLCIACYPGWALSATGDYYLDRLYMPSMLLLLYLLHKWTLPDQSFFRNKICWLACTVLTAIAAAIATERAAIMVIATLLFFLVLFPVFRNNKSVHWVLVTLLIGLALYLMWYFDSVYVGLQGGGNLLNNARLTPAQWLVRLQHPAMLPFALTNFLFIGWLALFAGWRNILLLFGTLIPNLLITIGGAELTGWSTHYHTMYIPFLIFTSSIGYLELNHRMSHKMIRLVAPVAISCFAVGCTLTFNPFTARWGTNSSVNMSFGITKSVFRFFLTPKRSGEKATAYWLHLLDAEIPKNVKISATEGVMPALYKSRQVALYPFGMDAADYLVIAGSATEGAPTVISGATSYLGKAEEENLNACLAKRAADQGFMLSRDIPATGTLVFKRQAGETK